jgi:tRNA pseudouridine32 synthase/23S rRNA pseudouridine746 synthase
MEAYAPPTDPIDVLHEDQHLLVVEKPPGLLSVPGKGPDLADCLLARLQAIFPETLLVHRLDRDTSGLMVFARTPHAQRHLGLQFEKRMVRKAYVARVWGVPEARSGEVDAPLIVDWPNRPRQKVCTETGRPAVTGWKRIGTDGETARLRLFPKTGRSHQLRVHCKHMGHPIMGDPFYADGPARAAPRLMLHAEELRFKNPEGGQSLRFRSNVPF